MKCRVAVTGLGVMSPVGNSPDELIDNLCAGRSGIGLDAFPDIPTASIEFDAEHHFSKMDQLVLDRFSQFAIMAAGAAMRDAGLANKDLAGARCGIYLGSGMGGAGALDQAYDAYHTRGPRWVPPMSIVKFMTNAAAANLSIRLGVHGPVMTYAAACASSAIAIGEAGRAIRDGYLDIALAGGTEAVLNPGGMAAWSAMRVLAPTDPDRPEASCRPFSLDRGGLVLGEGAGVVVLERVDQASARGHRPRAVLAGYGIASDAYRIATPRVDGQAEALRNAISDAGIALSDVQYINAHGTGTVAGDATEIAAIKEVFGAGAYKLAVTSTKALHGHMLGAAGVVELIATIMAIQRRAIPPTCHYRVPDPACDLDLVPNVAREDVDLQCAMSNSFAFGGTNVSLVVTRL
jgi:3-oxoacyl-[acyl-carrier-protein] synthase II